MHRIPRTARVEAVVDARPDQVWTVLSDVTRVGEWSHECARARWKGGAVRAAPGARFRGHNNAGIWRWSRLCEITEVAPPQEMRWRTVGAYGLLDSTEWVVRLEPMGPGTRIVQSYRVLRCPVALELLYAALIRGHRDRTDALTSDLKQLGAVARSGGSVARPPTHSAS